jgi:hypothetical protein
MPSEFALIIGDAVHNLRSALDLLTWETLSHFNVVRPRQVQFPFRKEGQSIDSALKERQILQTECPVVIDAFRDPLACSESYELLRGLHDLSICDKHKLIIPVKRYFGVNAIDLDRLDPSFSRVKMWAGVETDSPQARIYAWPISPESLPLTAVQQTLDAGRAHTIEVEICFAPGQPFEGRLVDYTLMAITNAVEKVIRSFASLR